MSTTKRIESLDLLKGLVMVIMALDHTRDYFHNSAFLFGPTDPEHTYFALFFTRWISHFCAPAFCFLAGTSAFLVGRRKSKAELSSFLLKRGLWLIFVEVVIVSFGWNFDIHFHFTALQVIWSLGICMILLAAIIHLPLRYILAFSLVVIGGHNALEAYNQEGNVLWSVLHLPGAFQLSPDHTIRIIYPIIPWVGVMSLGYYFGQFYDRSVEPAFRKKLFNRIGVFTILLFFLIRGINHYGNLQTWTYYTELIKTLYSFMDPAKYPPSLTYLLMTIGPSLLFLANTENLGGKVVNFFSVFGKVPFFYYILHIYLIHALAMLMAQLTGFGWQSMILDSGWRMLYELNAAGYGVDLWAVYLLWIAVVIMLYPLCSRFSDYKLGNKEKKWLSYL